MALTVQETVDSLKLTQGVRDGYLEPKLTRKFVIQGGGRDPAQLAIVGLSPLFNTGYFTQTSQTLAVALTNATVYTALVIAGSTVFIASGSSIVLGQSGASQTLTTTADVNIGDTSIAVSSFTTARAYGLYNPITPGTVAPTNVQDIYCNSRSFIVRPNCDVINNPIIDFTCEYGLATRLPANNISIPQWEYDIQTENVHQQTAKSQTHWPSANSDPGLAIGVQSDGSIQGVDILAPKSVLKCNVKQRSFSQAYQDTLELLVGTTNDATFQGYAAGRLLFLGCTATQKGQGEYECQYSWLKQPASVTIPYTGDFSGTQNVVKPAHTYLWIRNSQKASSGVIVQTKDIHVATVYATGDYSGFNFSQ